MSNKRVPLYRGSKVIHVRNVDVSGWCKNGWSIDQPLPEPVTPIVSEEVEVVKPKPKPKAKKKTVKKTD